MNQISINTTTAAAAAHDTVYTARAQLRVAQPIVDFVEHAAAARGLDLDAFWRGADAIIHDLSPKNRALLAHRDELQARIDAWHREHPGQPDPDAYRAFLQEIGYLEPEPEPFAVTTAGVDAEIAEIAGPQLVVPLLNARFALNAVNARWGSLYDALYGTDAIERTGELSPGEHYNEARGAAVIERGRELLDRIAPLATGSHRDATAYRVRDGELVVHLHDGATTGLVAPEAFAGHRGGEEQPEAVLLAHHGLHVEIVIDPNGTIGSGDDAGVQDLLLESALTTIMDLEDSVAAVDADDKALGYRNWLGLMDGTLSEQVSKNGTVFTRTMHRDREYTAPDGSPLALSGRSVLFVRNVGHLMRTDAVLDRDGAEVPEGILDAIMTVLGSLADLTGPAAGRNSRTGSIYIVKPKMHGRDEVAFAVELFARVEELFGLPACTVKIGIMDEERRTSVNLAACIEAARERVVFINTGFLDRTGDEIHTSLWAGPMPPKAALRTRPWLGAYENRNVAIGVDCGLDGRAQIGKGMWAMPDLMGDMLEQKIGHVRAGASTAWVPSPTAATLHALHYHRRDAFAERRALPPLPHNSLAELLRIPLAADGELSARAVSTEVDNCVQSILGYVVRWIDQGIGCSKVPDINDVALMEDRATLRISSQLLANWLAHGVISEAQVDESLLRLAAVVDRQNAADSAYEPLLGEGPDGIAFQAARRLIVEGAAQPNGYTEPLLHALRRAKKDAARLA
ncbi:malate synthase G [Leucobacter triazinivorans]|uniref:Malate synthase G n=1 Tax=Leucobacter triazinivorans TaxID=1784719 RepID=A0A4P6KGJ2_9MICO|nr:malate synthase G [Leucobacter triazinivorans]QBE49363.1 malate synthase G [Leucobacter triazinivorans]